MFNWIPGGFAKEISRSKFLMLSINYIGWQLPFLRGYLTNSNGSSIRRPRSSDGLSYQFFGAIYNQRHKRYILKDSTNILEVYRPLSSLILMAEKNKGFAREPGHKQGALADAKEAELLDKMEQARLEKLEKTLKDLQLDGKNTAGKTEKK